MNYKARLRARQDVEAILQKVLDENEGNLDYLIGVSMACRGVADLHFPAVAPIYNDFVMDNKEAIEFEKQETLIGEFSGKTIRDTPVLQLAEAADQTDDLKRYLRSKRAQWRWDQEVPEDEEGEVAA